MREKYFRFTIKSGSAKVFNCHRITQDIDQAAKKAGTQPRHLFTSLGLNKSVIIKVVEPSANKTRPAATSRLFQRAIKTKIHFSYDDVDVTKGGASIYFDHVERDQALLELAGLDKVKAPDVFKRDMGILNAMATLPSLDPFLLKDRLSAFGDVIDPGYFAISQEEWERIARRIRAKIRPMVLMAHPGGGDDVEAKAQVLLDKLWESKGLDEFAPFFKAMNLPVEKTAEIMQAWKGVTFYEIEYGQVTPKVQDFARWLKDGSQAVDTLNKTDRADVDRLRESVRSKIKANLAEISQILVEYQESYDDLFIHRRAAQRFGSFLGAAPLYFANLGGALNEVSHAILVWAEMSSRHRNRQMKGSNLIEMFEVVEDIFGGRETS